MTRPGEKNISAFINPQVSEKFSEQTESRAQFKRRAIEGAIKLWLSLPNEVQSRLIENPPHDDIQKICEGLGNRLHRALRKTLLLEIQSEKTKEESGLEDKKSRK